MVGPRPRLAEGLKAAQQTQALALLINVDVVGQISGPDESEKETDVVTTGLTPAPLLAAAVAPRLAQLGLARPDTAAKLRTGKVTVPDLTVRRRRLTVARLLAAIARPGPPVTPAVAAETLAAPNLSVRLSPEVQIRMAELEVLSFSEKVLVRQRHALEPTDTQTRPKSVTPETRRRPSRRQSFQEQRRP